MSTSLATSEQATGRVLEPVGYWFDVLHRATHCFEVALSGGAIIPDVAEATDGLVEALLKLVHRPDNLMPMPQPSGKAVSKRY